MINHLFIATFIVFITSSSAAIFILLSKPLSQTKIAWTFFNIFTGLWGGFLFLSNLPLEVDRLAYARIGNISATLIPLSYLYFCLNFCKVQIKSQKLLYFIYPLGLIYSLITIVFPDLFIPSISFKSNIHWYSNPGPIYLFFPIYFISITIYSLSILWQYYKNSSDLKIKNQALYLFLGSLIGYIGGFTTFFEIFDISLPPYGAYLVPVYVITSSIAIIKHQLMDIRILLKRSLVYTILITFITLTYLCIIVLAEKLFQDLVGYKSYIVSFIAAGIIALLFIPLRNYIQSLINKIFLKKDINTIVKENELLREELIQAERLKTSTILANGIAHEIKNPLTSIKTFCEYLPKRLGDKEFLERFSHIVNKEVDRIDEMIHQLLDYAKPAKLKLQQVNLIEIVEQILDLLSSDFLKRNIKAIKYYDGSDQVLLTADYNQLKQAILNIIMNAMDAIKKDGQIEISINKDEHNILLQIKDSGYGIDKKDLPRIFDPFYSKKDQGTGLGLAITQQIVQEHGGELNVESKKGIGTTFGFEFPL